MISRRVFLGSCAAALAAPARDRLGIMCLFGEAEEAAARKVLAAAREAGFRRIQVQFPWEHASAAFVQALPRWIAAADLRTEVLSAYVNCAAPGVVLMGAGAADFDRAIDAAASFGASRLVAWTGSFSADLMKADQRNFSPGAADGIRRFLEPRLKRLEANRLTLALETYITLVCPDAPSLRRTLDGLPPFVTAVLDPPNLTPVARYRERDRVIDEILATLAGRIGVVHLKDFRLAKDGKSYDLPGPLGGEMNYRLYAERIKALPEDIPLIAEHLAPAEFASARRKLVPLLS